MIRAPLPLVALLLLGACDTGGSRQQAAEVLARVLDDHRATIEGLGRPSAAGPPRVEPPRRAGSDGPGSGGPGSSGPGSSGRAGGAPGTAAALLGQGPDAVLAAFGTPTLRRPDGDAEVWLYLGPHCALDLILYRGAGAPRVAYAAARANSTESRTESACLREVAGNA